MAQVKGAASGAIVAGGGTITHHHAVGRDHAPWMQSEVGERGVGALRALKAELDPAGIMNPGKLLAVASAARRRRCNTIGPGFVGVLAVSRVSSIVWYLAASFGSSAPPCTLPLEPTSGRG